MSVSTFTSQSPQIIDTYAVHFTVTTKESSHLDLNTNFLIQITSPIQQGPLQPSDLKFLQSISPEKLADVIPDSADTAAIDVFGVLLIMKGLHYHQVCHLSLVIYIQEVCGS